MGDLDEEKQLLLENAKLREQMRLLNQNINDMLEGREPQMKNSNPTSPSLPVIKSENALRPGRLLDMSRASIMDPNIFPRPSILAPGGPRPSVMGSLEMHRGTIMYRPSVMGPIDPS